MPRCREFEVGRESFDSEYVIRCPFLTACNIADLVGLNRVLCKKWTKAPVLRNSYTLCAMGYGLRYVIIRLLQIDTPEACVQIPRTGQDWSLFRVADCHRGLLESDYVALVA
jgi:hypothetical protein